MPDIPPDPQPLSDDIKRRLKEAQLFLMNEQSKLGLWSNPILVLFISTVLWTTVDHNAIIAWLVAWGLIFLIRVFGYFQIKKISILGDAADKWHNFVIITTTPYALIWGVALFVLWPVDSPPHQLVLTMPVVAMVAAGAAAYAPVKKVAQLFVLALIFPLIIRFATAGGAGYMAVSAMGVIYIAVSLGIIKNLHASGAGAFLTSFENQEMAETLRSKNADLEKALGSVKALSGLLPICANCKKIRDDHGYYQQIEHYITEHSEAEFTHGICPDCAKELYPGITLSDG